MKPDILICPICKKPILGPTAHNKKYHDGGCKETARILTRMRYTIKKALAIDEF